MGRKKKLGYGLMVLWATCRGFGDQLSWL